MSTRYLNYGDSYYSSSGRCLPVRSGWSPSSRSSGCRVATLRALGWVGIAVSAVLLILTYTPLGIEFQGNRNWLDLGPAFRIQPSRVRQAGPGPLGRRRPGPQAEAARPARSTCCSPTFRSPALIILLIVFQGDAGTAVVSSAIVVGVLWMVGAPLRVFAGLAAAGFAGVIAACSLTSPTRMSRFAAFLNPTLDVNGINHQATAGMYAIASGGWWGVGLGASRQKWGTLPEAHSDFIFAVIGEELGLFGSLMVLAMFLILGYAGIRIALPLRRPLLPLRRGRGTAWFMVQALINLGCVLRLLPIAGVPLPLVSYGGSALLANLAAVGRAALVRAQRAGSSRGAGQEAREDPQPRMTAIVGSRSRGASSRSRQWWRAAVSSQWDRARGTGPRGPGPVPVVLAGGGTAGHTSPLIATAHELLRLQPDVGLTAVGTARGLEMTVVPAAGLALELIPPVPLPRRPGRGPVPGAGPARGGRSRAAAASPRQVQADAVLGFGGYVSTPVYLAARRLGVPIVIHEQNALPGLANRVAARFTTHVLHLLPGHALPHASCIGLPLRRAITELDRAAARPSARRRSALAGDLPTLLVSGGSQGALSINTAVAVRATSSSRAGDPDPARARAREPDRRTSRSTRPGDRSGLPAAGLRRADGAGLRRRRPDAGPLRREHRPGDRGRRPAGHLRPLSAWQRRAGAATPRSWWGPVAVSCVDDAAARRPGGGAGSRAARRPRTARRNVRPAMAVLRKATPAITLAQKTLEVARPWD